ncbi:MAG: hypothetical protein ACYDH9_03345 [Limisphaerales bacterium]
MPDVYISRAGMESNELDEKFTQREMRESKNALAKKEQEDRIKADRIKQLERAIEVIQENFPSISKIVEASLRRRISGRH